MSERFLQKAEKEKAWRKPTGELMVTEACDVTVSLVRVAGRGYRYRCFECTASDERHWVHVEAGAMLLHVIDQHLMVGERVPAKGLHKLAKAALER